jgi:hypothetical protein
MDNRIFLFLFTICLVCVVTGIVYLVEGNASSGKFVGILTKATVYTDTSCNTDKKGNTRCSSTYYVMETFDKDNTGHTCTVQRLIPYYYYGSADAFATSRKLGTTRTIWTSWYSHGTCYDEKIKWYYNCIGYSCFFIGLSPAILLLITFFIVKLGEIYQYIRGEEPKPREISLYGTV